MELILNKKAEKDLAKLPFSIAKKILIDINQLKNFPNVRNVKKLTNFTPDYRFRIGDYRVLFEVQNDNIIIYRILHRKDAY